MAHMRIFATLFCLAVCQIGRADLTLRQSFEIKFSPALPAEALEAAKKQMGSALPSEIVMRVKGEKIYTKFGQTSSVMDCGTDRITFLNVDAKRYATVPMSEYPGKLLGSETPAAAMQKIFQDMKFDVETRKTGRSGMLNGIRADEYQMTLSIE